VHADEVISVHDCVNEPIQNNSEVNISIKLRVGVEPVKEENSKMMVDMKKGELTPFLSEDNEDGVPKVPDLGNIKQPKKVG
jgi:hypothetical protein